MINLKKVSKRYGKNIILNNVNLKIEQPGLYLVRGNNGSGKTTLINIIARFIKAKGRVSNKLNKDMGYLLQKSNLVNNLTIKDNLALFDINVDILKKYKIVEVENKYPYQLSSGQLQKISIIIALSSDNKLIILDEPFNNLDIDSINIIKNEIIYLKKDRVIIMVSHNWKEIIDICDGFIDIKEGNIKYKIKKNENILANKKHKVRKLNKSYRVKSFKYYLKSNIKIYGVIFACISLFFTVSIAKYVINNIVNEDISYSMDYNKFYLKECKYIENNGFVISKCSNPNKDKLEIINSKYGFNYDYLLNYFYNRDNLFVISNEGIRLKMGRYPSSMYEVIASDNYDLHDTIKLSSNVIINDKHIDIYNKDIVVKVVGIYNESKFFNEDNIFFDYECVDNYYKNEIFLNNKISVYDYYNNLDIPEYKYLSFDMNLVNEIDYEGRKYEFYNGINDLIIQIYSLLDIFKIIVLILGLYMIIKVNKIKLIDKQKDIMFLLANSFSRVNIIFNTNVYDLCYIIIIYVIFSCTSFLITKDLTCILEISLLALIYFLIMIIQSIGLFSKGKLAHLLREEI